MFAEEPKDNIAVLPVGRLMIILFLSYILTAVQACKEYETEVAQLAIKEEWAEDKKYWYSGFSKMNSFSPSHSYPYIIPTS